jgi:hypothetical protein
LNLSFFAYFQVVSNRLAPDLKTLQEAWISTKHEFGICPHIMAQVIIGCIHKVIEFAPRNVVEILWDEFQLNAFFEKFPCVTMGLPFLLPHCLPPCEGIALQI